MKRLVVAPSRYVARTLASPNSVEPPRPTHAVPSKCVRDAAAPEIYT